ncbi:MAG: response regulator transcription factor, partial [Sedimentisphaerales bacterium]|nr:response regulator transcription factor [Sedimentisphaerales bacterium]
SAINSNPLKQYNPMETILIVEDDPTMLRGLKDNFEFKGYRVLTAADGENGLNAALNEKPDLILLDIMLPKINGYEICRLVRKENLTMPIIMLTAKGEESDIILGLNLGADDYVTKPFSIKELLARAAAFLRRSKQAEQNIYEFAGYRLDITARKLTRQGKEIKLSPKEFKLLEYFLKRQGRALTRDEILNAVWGYDCYVGSRSIDRFVTTLRNKIEPDPHEPVFIHTIREIGYKFELPE